MRTLLVPVAVLLLASAALAAEPEFRKDGVDAAAYGMGAGYPLGTRFSIGAQPTLIGALSRYDELLPARTVVKGTSTWSFKRDGTLPAISYLYQGTQRDLQDYLDRNPVTGFLVAHDDTILFERYQYDRTDAHRLTSQSMAKTVTAMLIGIAVGEGKIRSIDDLAEAYVPDLAGSAYGRTPIRALLNMSSGVAFEERYDGRGDSAKMARGLFVAGVGESSAKVMAQFTMQVNPPGRVFHYAGSETMVLGLVLRAATDQPVAGYLSEKIWQPIGAEADASWVTDVFGQEATLCCFNAVLRDYARFARLLAHEGAWNDRQLIPRQWVKDATTVRAEDEHLRPGRVSGSFGYGYQVWLLGNPAGTYSLRGIRGQAIFVDPASKLVMVQTSARPQPIDPGTFENVLVWRTLVEQVRR